MVAIIVIMKVSEPLAGIVRLESDRLTLNPLLGDTDTEGLTVWEVVAELLRGTVCVFVSPGTSEAV